LRAGQPRYRRLALLGRGSQGTAYLVADVESDKRFVLKKVLDPARAPEKRIAAEREVESLTKLNHPAIVGFVDGWVDEISCAHMILMEYVDGSTLKDALRAARASEPPSGSAVVGEETLLAWAAQLLSALAHMHERSILHRDIKTSNVLLTPEGTLKLIDFGAARSLADGDDLATTCIGTPYYLAPEMIAGRGYGPSADVWALGVLLYEVAMGRVPFSADNLPALAVKIMDGRYPPIDGSLSGRVHALVARCLTKDPEGRPSASQLLEEPAIKELAAAFLARQNPTAVPAWVAAAAAPAELATGAGTVLVAPTATPPPSRVPSGILPAPPATGDAAAEDNTRAADAEALRSERTSTSSVASERTRGAAWLSAASTGPALPSPAQQSTPRDWRRRGSRDKSATSALAPAVPASGAVSTTAAASSPDSTNGCDSARSSPAAGTASAAPRMRGRCASADVARPLNLLTAAGMGAERRVASARRALNRGRAQQDVPMLVTIPASPAKDDRSSVEYEGRDPSRTRPSPPALDTVECQQPSALTRPRPRQSLLRAAAAAAARAQGASGGASRLAGRKDLGWAPAPSLQEQPAGGCRKGKAAAAAPAAAPAPTPEPVEGARTANPQPDGGNAATRAYASLCSELQCEASPRVHTALLALGGSGAACFDLGACCEWAQADRLSSCAWRSIVGALVAAGAEGSLPPVRVITSGGAVLPSEAVAALAGLWGGASWPGDASGGDWRGAYTLEELDLALHAVRASALVAWEAALLRSQAARGRPGGQGPPLKRLLLSGYLEAPALTALARCVAALPHGLTTFHLKDCPAARPIAPAGILPGQPLPGSVDQVCAALSASPHASMLTDLTFQRTHLGNGGTAAVCALLAAPGLCLETLDLAATRCDVAVVCTSLRASAEAVGRLKSLTLSANPAKGPAVAELSSFVGLARELTHLRIADMLGGLRSESVASVVQAALCNDHLTALALDASGCSADAGENSGEEVARAFAAHPAPTFTHLFLAGNAFSPRIMVQLLRALHNQPLRELNLDGSLVAGSSPACTSSCAPEPPARPRRRLWPVGGLPRLNSSGALPPLASSPSSADALGGATLSPLHSPVSSLSPVPGSGLCEDDMSALLAAVVDVLRATPTLGTLSLGHSGTSAHPSASPAGGRGTSALARSDSLPQATVRAYASRTAARTPYRREAVLGDGGYRVRVRQLRAAIEASNTLEVLSISALPLMADDVKQLRSAFNASDSMVAIDCGGVRVFKRAWSHSHSRVNSHSASAA